MLTEKLFSEFMEESQMLKDYKNRGKIAIDENISVPLVKFPGIPQNECIIINELAKEVLRVSRDKNNSNEVAITYLMGYDGPKEDCQKYRPMVLGNETGIDIEADPDTYHLVNTTGSVVIINMHNHPSGSEISIEDLMYFLKKQSLRMMIVLPNDGGLYYIIKDLDRYRRSEAIIEFANIVHNINPEAFDGKNIHIEKMSYEDMINIAKTFIRKASVLGMDYEFVPSDDYLLLQGGDGYDDIW